MEEGAKYFPSESVIKKSISSQIYSRGNKYYQEKKKSEKCLFWACMQSEN